MSTEGAIRVAGNEKTHAMNKNGQQELSGILAGFIVDCPEQTIPAEAYTWAQAALIDYMSVLILGSGEDSARIVRKILEQLGGHPQATVWGSPAKTSVCNAAAANAVAAHALDFDDTNSVMLAHPSIQLFPGLLALGECRQCSGKDILTAYIIGFETGAAIGRAVNPGHIALG